MNAAFPSERGSAMAVGSNRSGSNGRYGSRSGALCGPRWRVGRTSVVRNAGHVGQGRVPSQPTAGPTTVKCCAVP